MGECAQGVGLIQPRPLERRPPLSEGTCVYIPPNSHYTRALKSRKNEARGVARQKDVERKVAGSIPERADRFSRLQSRDNCSMERAYSVAC